MSERSNTMKKITLLAAAVISTVTLGVPSLRSDAGNFQISQGTNRNAIIMKGNASCETDLQSIIQKLQNCFPGFHPGSNKPNSPQQPDNSLPDNSLPTPPDTETPDNSGDHNNGGNTNKPEDQLTYAEQVVALVNEERAKQGLNALTIDADVTAAAQVRAVEIREAFSHTRPDGTNFSTALKEQNISYRRSGENIAWGQTSPEKVMEAWMNSEGHRTNILNPKFTSIGVGYNQVNGVNYWTQLFVY